MSEPVRTVELPPEDDMGTMKLDCGSSSILPAALLLPEDLIARAIDKGVDVATMERLLAMRTQLRAEAAKEAYYRALAAFQRDCPAVVKSKTVMSKDGRSVRYRYAPLDEVVKQIGPLLSSHGFSYTLNTEQKDGQLTAICRTHHVGGHSEETRIAVPISGDYMSAQQLVGSARTYAARYAFCNAWGIMTADEDDDGNAPGASEAGSASGSSHGRKPSPRGPSPDPAWVAGAGISGRRGESPHEEGSRGGGQSMERAQEPPLPQDAGAGSLREQLGKKLDDAAAEVKAEDTGPEDFTKYAKHLYVIQAGKSKQGQPGALYGRMLKDIAEMRDGKFQKVGLQKLHALNKWYAERSAAGEQMSQAMLDDMHAISMFLESRRELRLSHVQK